MIEEGAAQRCLSLARLSQPATGMEISQEGTAWAVLPPPLESVRLHSMPLGPAASPGTP